MESRRRAEEHSIAERNGRRASPGAAIVSVALAFALALAVGGDTVAYGQIVDDPCQNPPTAPDADGDGTGDVCDPCPTDPDKRAPGHCGCGAPEDDPDGDGVPSCVDNCASVANLPQGDLDGDGVGDACECTAGGCIAGGGESAGDCIAQLVPSSGLAVAGSELTCVDGAACDTDPAPGVCGFRLGLCFGEAGTAPSCPAASPSTVDFAAPDAGSREAVLEAIAALPGTEARGATRVAFSPRNPGPPQCTGPIDIGVPVGEHAFDLTAESEPPGATDRDPFTLVCQGSGGTIPPPAGESPALRCQRAIEHGGARYVKARLRAVASCARRGKGTSDACSNATGDYRFLRLQSRWAVEAAEACAGVDVHHELGYLKSCGLTGSTCNFPSAFLAKDGGQNDLIDCMTCRIRESMTRFTRALVPFHLDPSPCARELALPGATLAVETWRGLSSCLGGDGAVSIAACLADPRMRDRFAGQLAKWRSGVESSCGSANVVFDVGYPFSCTSLPPIAPPFCADGVPACNFLSTQVASQPGGENDRLECHECQLNEALLETAQAIYGASVCCTERGCGTVRSRASCASIGGQPAYFAIDALAGGHSTDSAHAIGISATGRVLLPLLNGPIRSIDPTDGSLQTIGEMGFFPVGLALDSEGNLYGALRYEHVLSRLSPAGERLIVAGLFEDAGHSGDGGFANEARISAPDGVAVDAYANVYANDSGLIAAGYTGAPVNTGEWVRRIDHAGRIATVAGSGTFGTLGAGGDALAAQVAMPYSLATRAAGTVLVGEAGGQRVLELEPGGRLIPLAGRPLGILGAYSGDGGPALDARFHAVEGLAEDADGKVYVADFRNARVRLVDSLGSVITIAGTGAPAATGQPFGDDGVPGVHSRVGCAAALAIDADGRLYFPDLLAARVQVLTQVPY